MPITFLEALILAYGVAKLGRRKERCGFRRQQSQSSEHHPVIYDNITDTIEHIIPEKSTWYLYVSIWPENSAFGEF